MPTKQVKRKISSMPCSVIRLTGKETARGCDGKFFRMSKHSKFGIKMYSDWNQAEYAWYLQSEAYKKGLAPETGKILIIKYKNKHNSKNEITYFGYETKIAEPVLSGFRNNIYKKQCYDLESKLIKIGAGHDVSPKNCGIIDNKLVAIDFGKHSWT